LTPPLRSFLESRFGQDLGAVRIHTSPWAFTAARSLGARAFTLGHDIFFGEGEYAPESGAGLRLLAHELVHLVQQLGSSMDGYPRCQGVGDPADPLEAEADTIADQVCGTGRLSPIHPDRAQEIRRVIRVDAASASMTLDPGSRRAKPNVDIVTSSVPGKLKAVAHLTQGFNLARAAAGASVNDAVDDPVVKMSGKFDVVLTDPNDDSNLPGFSFGLIQVGTVFQLEDTYVGRTLNDGHVILHYRKQITQSFLLDSIASAKPFANRAAGFSFDRQKRIVHISCDLGLLPNKTGDSPGSQSGAAVNNRQTNSDNFLFQFKCDLGFTTVLVSIDPQQNVQALAHINWHLLWDFQFKWKGGQNPVATAIPITARADIGLPIQGAPTDAGVSAIVAKPAAPFFNDITDGAKSKTFLSRGAEREDNFSRPAGIPADFFT
jgi:hypothetical protein